MLTGRYKFEPTKFGTLRVYVEEHSSKGFQWRKGYKKDLKALEPVVADGWRFPEERTGMLITNGPNIGKRFGRC